MVVAVTAKIEGVEEVTRMLNRISPKKNSRWVTRALVRAAEQVQVLATTEFIIQGSRFRGPQGPRGGLGKLISAGVDPNRITSRHGGAGIVGSIAVDRGGTPRFVEVGTSKVYGPVHELGSRTTKKRPFLQPALEKASSAFERFFVEEWQKEIPR